MAVPVFFLDQFAQRQWTDPHYSGTRLAGVDSADFMARLEAAHQAGVAPLVDGYAPFCKHIFLQNFTQAKCGALAVTQSNRHLLRSGYSSRTPSELPVLQRWFSSSDVEAPQAAMLDVILYSREQLVKEREATGRGGETPLPPALWGCVWCLQWCRPGRADRPSPLPAPQSHFY
jgi:hypothetical protein